MFQNNQAKNGPKRAAFGDVSNTANLVRGNRDDSAVGRNLSKVSEKPLLAAPEKKPTVLSQPAQRPMTVSGIKGLLNSATNPNPTEVSGKQAGAPQAPADARKALNKRGNIYRDHVQQLPETTSKETTSEVAQDKGPESRPLPASMQQDNVKETMPKSAPQHDFASTDDHSALAADESGEAKGHEDDCKVHGEYGAHEQYGTVPETHEQVRGSKYLHESLTLPQPACDQMNAQSEPEEYWDEDDYENEEDDGYVTARSYRSRGDNTTGGATTVLFPRYNNQVRRELALAKQIVEATRTAEDVEDELWDTSMMAEYNDEIFDYIREQEVSS